ncbi:MAG: MmcQ/YjbR family DNA-binding protein [Clostridia bacterium]|nr:MmcQ/YjbR family DNA-binding protein [Clostridia bacterium]
MTYEGFAADVVRYIREAYGVTPEYLWKDSDSAALRHHADKKWFGVIMPGITWRKLGADRDGTVDILNVKCDPMLLPSLADGDGLFPGFHMNKQHWISIALDGSVPMEKLIWLADASYMMTLRKPKSAQKKKEGTV